KRKKLTDLYVVGKEITLDDGRGNETTVWLQKLNPVEHETAIRRANGKRAATLQLKRLDSDHPDRQPFASEISELASSRELMLDLLVADKLTKVMEAREAELAAEDEWAEDDYIQSLRDAWEDGLKEKYFSDDRDEESERVLNELKRFNEQLE